jgi:hypothetical protein
MINFVLDKSKNYAIVQQTLLESITRHLAPNTWTSSAEKRREACLNFALFVRQPADVVMSHGVADKNYFTDIVDDAGELYANRLKHLLVPGAWLKNKLVAHPKLRLGEARIHGVGWPRLDLLRALAKTRARPAAGARKRVLWAPTHDFQKRGEEKLSTSSYPAFEQHLPELERDFDVAVSLHPRNRPQKTPTDVALVDADVVISDFGTLVYEAWALGKPVFFPRWLLGDRIQEYLPGSAEAHIFSSRLGYHPGSMAELLDALHAAPVVEPAVQQFMSEYIDNYRSGSSGARIARVLEALDE